MELFFSIEVLGMLWEWHRGNLLLMEGRDILETNNNMLLTNDNLR
jgi:hypothetical protein